MVNIALYKLNSTTLAGIVATEEFQGTRAEARIRCGQIDNGKVGQTTSIQFVRYLENSND